MVEKSEEFEGEIRVASRIIDYLSSGLYPSPGACLKELVNNSYDADASLVEVFVKPDADRIIVSDDGCGMDRTEFEAHFKRISESHKRDGSDFTAGGRPKIGKIGIGFIAANEICELMEIYSTKSGSSELLHVYIDFQEMRKPLEERRRGESGDMVKADYRGEILVADFDSHYTQVFLTQVRGEAKQILAGAREPVDNRVSLYGLSPSSVYTRLAAETLDTWKELDAYSQTMLQVALNVPVKYFPEAFPGKCNSVISEFSEKVGKLGFSVLYDGTELFKPVVFRESVRQSLCSRFQFAGNHVAADGYFYAQHGTIKPFDLQGLIIRIRHAAVGEYDSTFWGFSPSEFSLLQRWVSLEVWADDRLEDAMNIDRRTLREAHPAYVELQEAIHAQLREILALARTELYQAASIQRSEDRASQLLGELETIAVQLQEAGAERAAQVVRILWTQEASTKSGQRQALRKYGVPDVYRLCLESASGEVDAATLDAIIFRLTTLLCQ